MLLAGFILAVLLYVAGSLLEAWDERARERRWEDRKKNPWKYL